MRSLSVVASLKNLIVSSEPPVAARISNALSPDPTLFFVIVDCLVFTELPPIVIVTAPSSAFVPLPMCNKESGESSPIPTEPSFFILILSKLLVPSTKVFPAGLNILVAVPIVMSPVFVSVAVTVIVDPLPIVDI